MMGVYWGMQVRAIQARDEFGALIFDDEGNPVYQQQFFKTNKGTVIPVPPDGFVVRSLGMKDYAITRDEMSAQFARLKFPGNLGYTVGSPTSWLRYTKR